MYIQVFLTIRIPNLLEMNGNDRFQYLKWETIGFGVPLIFEVGYTFGAKYEV